MANRSIAQAVNRTAVARALAQARAECVGQVAWMNAINRAALNLESCWWQFDGDTLVVASASSEGRYTVTEKGCECKAYAAGCACWHRAASTHGRKCRDSYATSGLPSYVHLNDLAIVRL